MRLLDLISQSNTPTPNLPPGFSLPSAHHFAGQLRSCPLRIVMADDLVRCATLLAYADGDRLSGCLDLIHAPMESVWVEWLESPRESALSDIPDLNVRFGVRAKRKGLLIQSCQSGRTGTIRTFWSMPNDVAYAGSVLSDFDFDRAMYGHSHPSQILAGKHAVVVDPEEPAIEAILSHVGFRFDPAWASYYRGGNLSLVEQAELIRNALGTAAYDAPMLFALFLLMTAKDGVTQRPSDLAKLNHARLRSRRQPLLDHIEVSLRLPVQPSAESGFNSETARRQARMHRVRGHLVRRGSKVFWRSSHVRGSARQGCIQTRTMALSFA